MDEELQIEPTPKKKKSDPAIYIRLLIFVIFVGIALFVVNKIAPKASLVGKQVSVDLEKKSETEAELILDATRARAVPIDGIQLVATVTAPEGTTVSFAQGSITGLNPLIGKIEEMDGQQKLTVVFLTTPPEPFVLENKKYSLGTIATSNGEGDVTVSFDESFAKVLVHKEGNNILAAPGEKRF